MMRQNNTHLFGKVLLLVMALTSTTGFRFHCYMFCGDQTALQTDYVEERDRCRKYAELKLSMIEELEPQKDKKTELVNLFSDCMARSGWTIPDGREGKPEGAAAAATVPPIVVTPNPAPAQPLTPQVDPARVKAALSRSSECAFARYAASTSSIAAARAKACDLECANRLKAAPEAPRPAACPAEFNPALAIGQDLPGGADEE